MKLHSTGYHTAVNSERYVLHSPQRSSNPNPSSANRWSATHDSAIAVTPPDGRYLIVAPHPDDEVLTVGGLIAQAVRAGSDVAVLAVTDGGNAYPGHVGHDALAAIRRAEQIGALAELGVPADRTHPLGVHDGAVAANEPELIERICESSHPATTIVAPWIHDFHADHEAVGRAAQAAADRVGCSLWFSLFWAWHHADSASFDGVSLIRVDLDQRTRQVKEAALRHHASQLQPDGIEPMLDTAALEPARWTSEYFIVHQPGRVVA